MKQKPQKEVTLHVRVGKTEVDQLDDASGRLGLSRSDLLRRCLSLGLMAFENTKIPGVHIDAQGN